MITFVRSFGLAAVAALTVAACSSGGGDADPSRTSSLAMKWSAPSGSGGATGTVTIADDCDANACGAVHCACNDGTTVDVRACAATACFTGDAACALAAPSLGEPAGACSTSAAAPPPPTPTPTPTPAPTPTPTPTPPSVSIASADDCDATACAEVRCGCGSTIADVQACDASGCYAGAKACAVADDALGLGAGACTP